MFASQGFVLICGWFSEDYLSISGIQFPPPGCYFPQLQRGTAPTNSMKHQCRINLLHFKKYFSHIPLIHNGDFALYLGGTKIVNDVSNLPWYPWTYVLIGSTTTILQISFIIYKKIQSTKIDPKNTVGTLVWNKKFLIYRMRDGLK